MSVHVVVPHGKTSGAQCAMTIVHSVVIVIYPHLQVKIPTDCAITLSVCRTPTQRELSSARDPDRFLAQADADQWNSRSVDADVLVVCSQTNSPGGSLEGSRRNPLAEWFRKFKRSDWEAL